MFRVLLHVKISSHCFSFVGDPQDDPSWPVQIREKIGKHSLESASNGYDTHYRECLSSCRTICFKIQMNVFCSSMQMCVSSQNHSYLFVCLQCWGQQWVFLYSDSDCDFACLQEYICPRCDSGFIEEVTEDSRWAALPHSLFPMACCNSCTARLPWRLFSVPSGVCK